MIGIFGGSFNPIHVGHIQLARQIRQAAALDEVWFMVSPLNPFKRNADDLLAGFNTTGLKATDMATVGIVFDHLLARLNVNLTFKSQWETTPEDITATYTAVADAIVNYWEGTSLPNGTAKVLPLSDATTAPGFQYSLHGIIIPQTGFRVITVNVEGKNYTYTHPGDIPLGKGMITTVNLIIGRQTIELGTLSIDRWSDGGNFDGTGQRQ